jgi:hypothetical protein
MIPSADAERILLTGATGYVGGKLPAGPSSTQVTRCAAWSATPTARDVPEAATVVRGDVRDAPLPSARRCADTDVAYYLVHSMGGTGGDFARRRPRGAAHLRRRGARRAACRA